VLNAFLSFGAAKVEILNPHQQVNSKVFSKVF